MWNPEVTVTIAGTDFTADTVANVNITYGRSDITQNIRTGYANINIITDWNGIVINFAQLDLNASVVITLDTSTGTETIFTGVISDYTVNVLGTDLLQYSIIAVSPLARLARATIGADGYPAEYQGERIKRILIYGTGGKTWGQSTIQWQNATYAWGLGTDIIGTLANGFDFGSEVADEMNAFQALLKASQFGFVFENPDGTIDFYDFYSRTGSAGYTTVSGSDTLRDGLNSQLTSAQVANSVTVISSTGTEYSSTNQASIDSYGVREVSFDTYQSNATQLNTVLNNYIDDWNTPRLFVDGFEFPLSTLGTSTRDTLIGIRGNDRLLISNIPAAIRNEAMGSNYFYRGIVEGWQWSIVKGEAFLSVNLSDWELNQVFV